MNYIKEINKKNKWLPRLVIRVSNIHVYADIIDDKTGQVLVSANSQKIEENGYERDKLIGKKIASLAKNKKIKHVVLDKGKRRYHGHVQKIADSARESGLIL